MDTKHTPGPWEVDVRGRAGNEHDPWHVAIVGTAIGRHVVIVDTLNCSCVFSPGDQRANARLIAAAPDSHQANRAFVAATLSEHRIPENTSDDYIYDTIGSALAGAFFKARAAIAKAEGR